MSPELSREQMFRSEKVNYLSCFPQGQSGTVVDMVLEPELQGRLMGMGLFVGTKFRLLQGGNQLSSSLLLAVGETRISFGKEIANKILVE